MRANSNSYDEPVSDMTPIKIRRKPPNLDLGKGAFNEYYDSKKAIIDASPPRWREQAI